MDSVMQLHHHLQKDFRKELDLVKFVMRLVVDQVLNSRSIGNNFNAFF